MEQLDLLWEYQEQDIILYNLDNERKNSELRHTLIKLKKYLMEQQDKLVKMDEEADRKCQIYNKINHELESIVNAINSDKKKIENNEISNIKQFDQMYKNALAMKEKLEKKDHEIKILFRDLEVLNKKLQDIRKDVTKVKKEYADVKSQYDEKLENMQAQYSEAKAKMDKLLKDIDKAILSKYNNIKSSRHGVLATINEDRCGGCNMSLASLVIHNVKEKKKIVECENCGRILYYR